MTVVLDSNVAVALALDAERAPTIEERLRAWEDADEDLHAPSLFRFEVANALTRNVVPRGRGLSIPESRLQFFGVDQSLRQTRPGSCSAAAEATVAQAMKGTLNQKKAIARLTAA